MIHTDERAFVWVGFLFAIYGGVGCINALEWFITIIHRKGSHMQRSEGRSLQHTHTYTAYLIVRAKTS